MEQKRIARIEIIDYIKGLAIFGIVIHHLISRYLDVSTSSLFGRLVVSGSNLLGGVEIGFSSFVQDLGCTSRI